MLIILMVILLLAVVGVATVAVAFLIRQVGREQQQRYDAEVAQFIAGTQPDPEFLQRQAEIERNIAAADALAAQLEQPEAAPPPPPRPAPSADPLPPDPTL